MAFTFKTYDGDTVDTLSKRRSFLGAIEDAGILDSDDEVGRILAFFARDIQQVAVPPPPIPPRPKELDSGDQSFVKIGSGLDPRANDLVSSNLTQQEQKIDRPSKGKHDVKHPERRFSRRRTRRHVDPGLPNNSLRCVSIAEVSPPKAFKTSPRSPSPLRPATDSIPTAPRSIHPKTPQSRPPSARPTPIMKYSLTSNGVGLGPQCRILVIDAVDSYPSAIVQYYLELFRVWTANTGGPWIFQTVQSAYIESGITYGGLPRLTTNTAYKRCHDPNLVNKVLPEDDRVLVGGCLSQESTHIIDTHIIDTHIIDTHIIDTHIIDTLRKDRFRFIEDYNLGQYDYIIASRQDQTQLIERAIMRNSLPGAKNAEILDLPMSILRNDVLQSKDMLRVAFKSIQSFLETKFGWQSPVRSSTGDPFKTAFVRTRLSTSLDLFELDRQNRKAEETSSCRLHWTSHPCEKGEKILAIVGPSRKIAEAKTIVDDVLIKYNWGHVMSQAPRP